MAELIREKFDAGCAQAEALLAADRREILACVGTAARARSSVARASRTAKGSKPCRSAALRADV